MTPRFSGHFPIFGLVVFVLKSHLRIARQRSREKFAILTLKPGGLLMTSFDLKMTSWRRMELDNQCEHGQSDIVTKIVYIHVS